MGCQVWGWGAETRLAGDLQRAEEVRQGLVAAAALSELVAAAEVRQGLVAAAALSELVAVAEVRQGLVAVAALSELVAGEVLRGPVVVAELVGPAVGQSVRSLAMPASLPATGECLYLTAVVCLRLMPNSASKLSVQTAGRFMSSTDAAVRGGPTVEYVLAQTHVEALTRYRITVAVCFARPKPMLHSVLASLPSAVSLMPLIHAVDVGPSRVGAALGLSAVARELLMYVHVSAVRPMHCFVSDWVSTLGLCEAKTAAISIVPHTAAQEQSLPVSSFNFRQFRLVKAFAAGGG